MAADTYSSDGIGVLLMGTGNDNNTWGSNCNTNVFQILADALANTLSSAVTGGTLDLSGSPPPAASSQARYAGLIFTGVLLSNQLVQIPNFNKWWLVKNATSGSFTLKFKTSGGSASTAIPQNSGWQMVRCDGSNVIEVWPFNTAQIQMPDGTVALPAYSNLTEPSSGWYRAGTQDWRLSINGVAVLQATGTGASSPSIINVLSPNALQVNGVAVFVSGSTIKSADGTVAAPGQSFNSEASTGLYRISAGVVGYSILNSKITQWSATGFSVTGTLDCSGNFAINTNKFTVAGASGNTVVAGTMNVAGLVTASAGLTVSAGAVSLPATSVADAALVTPPGRTLLATLTASNSATLSDTTSLTSTYENYEIVLTNLLPSTSNVQATVQIQSGGSFKTSGYLSSTFTADSGAGTGVAGLTTAISVSQAASVGNNRGGISGVLRINKPSSNDIHGVFGNTTAVTTGGSPQRNALVSGAWVTAGVIDGIRFQFDSGNVTSGTMKIYGLT